jgi:hypothetical protein
VRPIEVCFGPISLNATVHTVAACEPPFQKRETGDSCATDCSFAMTGWRTTKDVMDLRDEIVSKLDDAPPEVRRHAWYWISFHVNIEHELEERNSGSSLDDDTIEWLKTQPARYERNKEVKTRLVESLERRLAQAKHELQRLG